MTAPRPFGRALPNVSRAVVVEVVILGAILALAAWLRLSGLRRTSLFGDEAFYSGQAAALAGDPAAAETFGLFVAHPVLFQLLLALGFAGGLPIEGGRILTGLFGIGSVALAWAIGRSIGGRALGLASALLLALLAYHAYISRLVLLDGLAAFAIGCSLYALLRAHRHRSETWLAVAAGALGVAVIAKETSLLLLPAVAIAAVVEPGLRLGRRAWLVAGASFVAVVAAIPVSALLGDGFAGARAYVEYQLSRHDESAPLTYLQLIDPYFGWPFILLAVVGLLAALRTGGARRVIAIWAIVPAAILQAWGLRELQLPMLVVIQLAILVAIGLETVGQGIASAVSRLGVGPRGQPIAARGVATALLAAVVLGLAPLSLTATSLPGGQPLRSGLREASLWLRNHADREDGVFVSTAYKSSVVAYYSKRPAYGFTPAGRRDPIYRDPGDIEAFWEAGGVQWVVLDRDSQIRAESAETGRTPYDRLVDLLDARRHKLVYEVPGPTPDLWLARVYRVTEPPSGAPVASPSLSFGVGHRGVVAISYAACLALGAMVIVLGRRRSGVSDPGSPQAPESSSP